jgi:ABC-type nitrate/sulfonate/bicarbonate transport system, permease component
MKAFVPLHLDQALVRNALTSIERIALGFTLAVIMTVPLGVYMAPFHPSPRFSAPSRSSARTFPPSCSFP